MCSIGFSRLQKDLIFGGVFPVSVVVSLMWCWPCFAHSMFDSSCHGLCSATEMEWLMGFVALLEVCLERVFNLLCFILPCLFGRGGSQTLTYAIAKFFFYEDSRTLFISEIAVTIYEHVCKVFFLLVFGLEATEKNRESDGKSTSFT